MSVPALIATSGCAETTEAVRRRERISARMAPRINCAPMLFDNDMRAFAHHVVDALFDHVQRIEERPVVDWHSASDLRAHLLAVNDPRAALQSLLDYAIQLHHPAYMGHQVCPPLAPAVIADLVVSTLNQ